LFTSPVYLRTVQADMAYLGQLLPSDRFIERPSKTVECEARIDRLSTDITNGFIMRDTACFVV